MTAAGIDVMRAIAISGTRSTDHRPGDDFFDLFGEYLLPLVERPGVDVYVGGAVGIDTLALGWLARETEADITVAVPSTVADQPEPAQRQIEAAAVVQRLGRQTRETVQRSIVLADLSLAHVGAGDPATACNVLASCVDLVAETRGRVAAQRIRQVRRALDPWRTELYVQAVDDRILSALLR